MKQILFTGLLLLAAMQVISQTQNVDSLLNVLETQKLTSKEQLDLYYKIGGQYVYNDQEKFKEYADKGLELANKVKDKEMIIKFTMSLGIYYNHKASYDTSLEYYEKALILAKEINDKEKEADICGNIAAAYCNKGDLETGISYYHKAISIYESIGVDYNLSYWYANMGARYRQLGEFNLAINYLKKAESLGIKNNEPNALVKVYSSLGNLYWDQKELDKAMEYGLKSLKVSQDIHNTVGEAYAYQVLINVSFEKEKYDDMEKYATECLRISKEAKYNRGISVAWDALSKVYLNKGRYKEAEQASYSALDADSTNSYLKSSIMANISQANIYLGNKEKAIEYFQEYDKMKDEFNNKSVRESLMEQEVKYETQKKEAQIASLEKERRMYVWLGIAGGLLAISMGIVLWQTMRNARKEKQLIAAKAVQDGEMGERARIAEDLHDRLGGSLSAVKIELRNAESLQNVSDKLDQCIKEVREITHNLMPRSLLSSGMKTALEDYAAQFPNVHFHFFGEEKRIRERLEFIIYCCANELVTNAIRYSGAKEINMQLIQSEKHVSLTVQDDGCGFDEKTVTAGIGLKNIRDRVASCNGKLDILSSPGNGTEAIIDLKVEN